MIKEKTKYKTVYVKAFSKIDTYSLLPLCLHDQQQQTNILNTGNNSLANKTCYTPSKCQIATI